MGILSKAEIFAAQDIKREVLNVPEWGGDVELIQLSGNGRAKIMETYQTFKDAGSVAQTNALQDAMLLACIADDKGQPIFATDDLPLLREKNGVVLETVVKAALKLNGMGEQAEAAAEKN